MKTKITFTFCFILLLVAGLYAQSNKRDSIPQVPVAIEYSPPHTNNNNDSNKVYDDTWGYESGYSGPQVRPKFIESILKYLADSTRYPEEARKKNIQGNVIVSFIIEKNGSVSNVKVLGAQNEIFIDEAKRVITTMPKWTPGKEKGMPVRVQETVAVRFKL